MDLEQLVERYLAQLLQRGRGEHTLRAYRGDLGAFIRQAGAEDGRIDPAGLVRSQGSIGGGRIGERGSPSLGGAGLPALGRGAGIRSRRGATGTHCGVGAIGVSV